MPHVKVTMGLPVRIQVADGTDFGVPFREGLRTLVSLREYKVPISEGEGGASGIDDGRGTFLRSTVSVLFPDQTLEEILDSGRVPYVEASFMAINNCVEAYRYVTRHVFARPIHQPREITLVVVDDLGELVPNVIFTHAFNIPLGGMRLKPTLQTQTVEQVQRTIGGDDPVKFERSLLLDPEYFAELGDVRNAVFYVDTALQVFIDRILSDESDTPSGYYSKWDEGLKSVCGHSLYEGVFFDRPPFHENKVNAFEILETIHVVRNSIAHEGRSIFKVAGLGKWGSRFSENHKKWDGTEVTASDAREWVRYGKEIIGWVENILE